MSLPANAESGVAEVLKATSAWVDEEATTSVAMAVFAPRD
jgi:hypothetical protein